MALARYGERAGALRHAHEADHAASLARFGDKARPLLEGDLAQRQEALQQLAAPTDPALGPLASLLDAVEGPQGEGRVRKLLAWCLDPARGRGVAPRLWKRLLGQEVGLRGLRVAPEVGGEPWGSHSALPGSSRDPP